MFSKIFNQFISQKHFYFLILFTLTLIFLCTNIDIAIMLFIVIIFAAALNPLVDKLEKKINRPLATTIVLLGFFTVAGIFILPVFCLAIYEIAEFTRMFPQYVDNLYHIINNLPILKALGVTHINATSLTDALAESSSDIIESILTFASEASEALLYIFTAIILLFFFMVDKQQIKDAIIKLFPSEYREQTKNIVDTVGRKLSGYVLAQALVSGSVWIIMTLGLMAFHINYAILLGVIAGVLSIIPILGSGISLVICLISTYTMGIKAIIIVTFLYTFSHFIENHVVRPYVYSKFLKLHQAIIFLALIIGAKYQGVLGVILAPPFAMALCVLLDELYITKMDE